MSQPDLWEDSFFVQVSGLTDSICIVHFIIKEKQLTRKSLNQQRVLLGLICFTIPLSLKLISLFKARLIYLTFFKEGIYIILLPQLYKSYSLNYISKPYFQAHNIYSIKGFILHADSLTVTLSYLQIHSWPTKYAFSYRYTFSHMLMNNKHKCGR